MPEVHQPFRPTVSWLRILCILLVVVLLHLVIGYLMVLNAPGKAVVTISKPVEAVLIHPRQTQALPAAQTLVQPHVTTPRGQSSPPSFVPQADATPPVSQAAPVIQAAPAAPAAAINAPLAFNAPIAPAPSPVPVGADPRQVGIGLVCPTQVAPEMPRRALKEGIEGVVRAQIHVKGNRVVDITILSGPRIFHAAVREAMLQYRCMSEGGEVSATQDFNFKLE